MKASAHSCGAQSAAAALLVWTVACGASQSHPLSDQPRCPDGTKAVELAVEVERHGADRIEHERYCERPDRQRHGPYAKWDEPGPSSVTGSYRDGKRDGSWVWRRWGKKTEVGEFRDGRQHGRWVSYFEDGTPMTESQYRNGLLQGPYTTRCANGTTEVQSSYVEGKLHGPWKSHFCSGRVREVGAYREGLEQGEWTLYYETGHPSFKRVYEAGQLHGPMVRWDEDGTKVQGQHANGERDGVWRYWQRPTTGSWQTGDKVGEVVREETYDRGVLVEPTSPASEGGRVDKSVN